MDPPVPTLFFQKDKIRQPGSGPSPSVFLTTCDPSYTVYIYILLIVICLVEGSWSKLTSNALQLDRGR